MAELPEEVVARLSTCGPVKLLTGEPGDSGTAEAWVAPLDKQLYAFVFRGSRTEENLLKSGRAEIHVEDREGEWAIRVRGRGVAGRGVLSDVRRPELMHWLPEGTSPAQLLAARIHPEAVEYLRGKGSGRTRAAGPVPGGQPPPPAARWARLASDHVILWFVAMGVVDWLGLLVLVEIDEQRVGMLIAMTLAGVAMLGGVTLWNQANVFQRWREGLVPDEEAALMLEAWEPPGRVRRAGLAGMIGGLVLAAGIAGWGGWRLGIFAILTSGFPFLLPAHWIRHAMRRSDRAEEKKR
ncbi:MAG: hypothetical protein ACOZNI_26710 [Myxococcota bacterium]